MKRELPVIPVNPLPPLYGAWIDQLLAGPIPVETKATCDDCAMSPPPSGSEPSATNRFFDPVLKCCTYMPTLPNFIVGRILNDGDLSTQSRAGVLGRFTASDGVTPLGLSMTATYSLLYVNQASDVFGRTQSLRCPHLLDDGGGRCGIWQHRNSVCSTYFCKFVRAAVGQQFWMRMRELLAAVETDLARWCLLELGLDAEALQTLLAPANESNSPGRLDANAIAGLRDDGLYQRIWANWFGLEQEFYRQCASLVEALDWPGVISVCGPDVRIRAHLLREAYRNLLSEEIPPESIRTGNLNVSFLDQDSCQIVTYSSLDPVVMQKSLLDLLPYFDGRPTEDVLRKIRKERNIKLDRVLLRKLLDFKLLVVADHTEGSGSPPA